MGHRQYALQDIHYEFFLAEGSSVDSYRKACQRALEKLSAGQKWDLAIVQIEEPFHQLTARCNPYFASKVSFHTHQIPVQEFEIETTRRPDKELIYVLNNMGLATYAKLNGIPWLLKANPTIAHELVIGLGSANVGEGRFYPYSPGTETGTPLPAEGARQHARRRVTVWHRERVARSK